MNDSVALPTTRARWNVWAAATLALGAGVLAFLGSAADVSGPMAVFAENPGHHGRDAWIQLPLHMGIAVAILASGARYERYIPYLVAMVVLACLLLWMIFMTYAVVAGIPQGYTERIDVAWAGSLLGAYAAAAYLLMRSRRQGRSGPAWRVSR